MSLATHTCFDGYRRLASASLETIALIAKRATEAGSAGPVLIFDDTTGRSIDIDMRGTDEEVVSWLPKPPATEEPVTSETGEPRGRGRPKLGVVAREVTLLPRHWEWLATQSGGASVALRKLVEEARRTHGEKDRKRAVQERAYNFMSALAGNMRGFEEATRALFANDRARFTEIVAPWPNDVRDHALALAFANEEPGNPINIQPAESVRA